MKLTGHVVVTAARRIEKLPAPFLGELEGLKKGLARRGRKISDLGRYSVKVPLELNNGEPLPLTIREIKATLAAFLASEYGAEVHPEKEMLLLPGARTTLLLLAAFFADESATYHLPNPGYDAYRKFAMMFDAKVKHYQLYQRNDYLPNLDQLGREVGKNLNLVFINTPHNPSGTVCDQDFQARLHRHAAEHNYLLVVDSSYALPYAGNFRPPLYCETRRHLRNGLEMISFSTGFLSPELKLTILIGRRTLIQPLAQAAHSLGLKPLQPMLHVASSYFASVTTMKDHLKNCRDELSARIQIINKRLKESALDFYPASGTGYFWVKLRRRRISLNFARSLLRQKGILVAPGTSFGEQGEGWVRISANTQGEELERAIDGFCRHIAPLKSRLRRRKER